MFRCFSEGHPEVTYSWVHNGVGLRASNRVLLHSKGEVLEVRSIDSTDAGQYRCKAHNDVGEVSSNNAQLTVLTGKLLLFLFPKWDDAYNGKMFGA